MGGKNTSFPSQKLCFLCVPSLFWESQKREFHLSLLSLHVNKMDGMFLFTKQTDRVKRLCVWLMRIGYCRGFGIQSPSAYAFVRYVINEHYPYYAYNELKNENSNLSLRHRKLGKLYFRLSNYAQADSWISFRPVTNAYEQYIVRGCNKTRVQLLQTTETFSTESISDTTVVHLSLTDNYSAFYQQIIGRLGERNMLIIEGIKRNAATRRFWKQVMENERTGVCFDLYYCGIVFFDRARHKQNYIINF